MPRWETQPQITFQTLGSVQLDCICSAHTHSGGPLWAATSLHWSQRLMKMEGCPTVKSWSVFSSWAQQAWLIPWASVPLRLGPELSGSYTCTLLFFSFALLIARRHALFEVRIPLCPWMSSTPANGCRGTNNSKSEDRRHLGDLIEELV